MFRAALLGLLAFACYSEAAAVPKAPFTVDELMKLARVADPVLSPDGKLVAFSVQSIDIPNNAKPTQIYVVGVSGSETPTKITTEGTLNTRPRWSPDSNRFTLSQPQGRLAGLVHE